jgi:hypothetical protein
MALTVTEAAPGSAAPVSKTKEPEPVYKEEEYTEYVDDPRDGDYEEYDLDDTKNNDKK